MKSLRYLFSLFIVCFSIMHANAQYGWQEYPDTSRWRLSANLHYKITAEGSFSHAKTPLWLNANKYGVSSLEKNNGYLRASFNRPLDTDDARRWGIGYGIDAYGAANYDSKMFLQQAYVDVRWLHGVLTIGAKEYPMELKNNRLSSGSQTFGKNAHPVPQVRIALPRYWTIPGTRGWLQVKGHIAYGILTDKNWQHDFTGKQHKYADNLIYHSKAGYLRIGKDEDIYPFSVEMGLEMASMFGGTAYQPNGDRTMRVTKGGHSLRNFWDAFIPGGEDEVDTLYQNYGGNLLGSWVLRLNYNAELWRLSLYADHYFEDESAMFLLDYNGYGEGDEWQVKKKRRYYLYDPKDMLIGAELNLKYGHWLRSIVFEYINTTYQSGPVYHDHSPSIAYHLGGRDNYYNHGITTGWQHWGQVMGNPLYRSPIYNSDGEIQVEDSRFTALHLGLEGSPTEQFDYRLLASWQRGLGIYGMTYQKPHHNVSFMLEGTYHLHHNWTVRGAYGMDFGHILGHNAGFQLSVSKSGILNL